MVYEVEFFLTGLFFITFLIIITVFGFLLINIFYKKIFDLKLFEIVLISIGSGITFFIFYSYIIDTFLFFNFFTALLPLIIFDISGLIFLRKSNLKIKAILSFNHIKQVIIKKKNEIIIFILFFVIVFFFQILIQYFKIIESASQRANDPFFWFREIMYLIDYGHLEYYEIEAYSAGFVFLNAGMISFYPNYHFCYFFVKFSPILYMSLIIFIGFALSINVFKQKYFIFLIMFSFLILNYFNYRFLMPLPTIPATILFFIFSITFINSEIPVYLKGIVLSGIILCHPLFGLLSFGIYLLYTFFHFLFLRIKNAGLSSKFLKENIYNIIIFFVLLIPLFVNLTLKYSHDWYINYWHFIFPSNNSVTGLFSHFNENYSVILNPLILGTFIYSQENFGENLDQYFIDLQNQPINSQWFIVFILFYFFIRIKKKNYEDSGDLIKFIKISVAFLLFFNFMFYFLPFYPIDFGLRVWELMGGYLIFIFVFIVYDIYHLLRNLTTKIKIKFPKYKKFLNRDINSFQKKNRFLKSRNIIKVESIVILISLIIVFRIYQENYFRYGYKYNDDNIVEMMLALGVCEPPDSNITVLLPEFDATAIYNMLYRFNYDLINFSQNYNYTQLMNIVVNKKASYIVLPLNEISEEVIKNFGFSNMLYYQNTNYSIFKIN